MSVTEPVRRFEVFTGAGQRRRWSVDEKSRIVAESFGGVESVCSVARRHGLAPTQLFAWRKDARARVVDSAPMFVPVVVEPQPALAAPKIKRTRRRRAEGEIALEIDGVTVRIGRGADRRTLEVVLRTLKAERLIPGVTGPPAGVKVLVATKPVDFRKGMDGLARLVTEEMKADPFSGVVYVFRAKRADRVKLLWWDGSGVVLYAKRLEQGAFCWPKIADGAMRLTPSQLAALIDGMDWTRVLAPRRTRAPQMVA